MTKKQNKLFSTLTQTIRDIGWTVALPKTRGTARVRYLIIGEDKAVEKVIKHINDGKKYLKL